MVDERKAQYDLILWGATGFSGRLTAEYLLRRYGAGPKPVAWALAGRNQNKLSALREELAAIDPAAVELPMLLADSHDAASLEALVSQARVICSTVGPYPLYGTPLVETCVRLGRDYCDLTGETVWMRGMIERFHEEAAAKGARIVHCCGFDSVPSDLGCFMVQEQALETVGGPCDEVKAWVRSLGGGVSGGTLATAIDVLENSQDPAYRRLRADPYVLVPDPAARVAQPDQVGPVWRDEVGGWTAPFVMAATNTAVVHRSNALLDYRYGHAFRYGEVVRIGRRFRHWALAAGMSLLLGPGQWAGRQRPVRTALRRWVAPAVGEGPSREAREKGHFTMEFVGEIDGQPQVRARVSGQQDPGYGETAKMLGEAAVCLALDHAKLPARAGILTPAAAMGEALLARLRAAGMEFVVVDG
jgi:short subunit dehydrogenase-like uncharacterized protein